MIKVAVTGGIGSGKTIVCKVFELLGVPVFYADFEAKRVMSQNPEVKENLISHFGSDIYLPNGDIHRKKLSDIIFNDEIALQKVNNIVHPAVRYEFEKWSENQSYHYVIQEAALIFESKMENMFDKIITVYAPEEIKVARVMKRDNVSSKNIMERMRNQLSDDYKVTKSDFSILNDDSQMIIPQIIKIHNYLLL